VALIFALKVVFPDKVMLVRGNHEFQDQNEHMGAVGFKAACYQSLQRYGQEFFDQCQATFNYLPLGCVVAEKILVVHGGIGDGDWDLEEVSEAERPIHCDNVKDNPHIYNILWSDPIPETVEHSFGVHDSPRDGHRQLIHQFGSDVTQAFCMRNNLEAVVRSHQAKSGGCGYEVMHNSRLLRVFSARDYEGHQNDGAMLKVRWSKGGKLVIRPQVLRSTVKMRPLGEASTLASQPLLELGWCGFDQSACSGADAEDLEFSRQPAGHPPDPRSRGGASPTISSGRGGGSSPRAAGPRHPQAGGYTPGQAVRTFSHSQNAWVIATVESVGPDGSLVLMYNGRHKPLEPHLVPQYVQPI